jgi:hypothetical protein
MPFLRWIGRNRRIKLEVSISSTRLLTDDALLAECRWDFSRGSGPGGQKRNKTSNAARLTHLPSKIAVTATEARSLVENKKRAVHRLRLKLACEIREPVDLSHFEPPEWFLTVRRQNKIEASHRHALYSAIAGLLLDLLDALQGNPAAVAINLGISTTAVIKFLESDPHLWTAANEIRAQANMKPLTHRR